MTGSSSYRAAVVADYDSDKAVDNVCAVRLAMWISLK